MDFLVIDDDKTFRDATCLLIDGEGHYAEAASSGELGLTELKEGKFDAVLLDLNLGPEQGLDILDQILKRQPNLPVIIFTAQGSVKNAVEAMRRGAVDFLEKPFTREQFHLVLVRVQRFHQLNQNIERLEREVKDSNAQSPEILLESSTPLVKEAMDTLLRAAKTPASILILGESGTGKSVVARALHQQSHLADKPFVTVSCPSLSRELLESDLFGHVKGAFTGALRDHWGKVKAAAGGTLFLDEIGDLPMEIQPKLLRLLQEREYERVGENITRQAEVRVIAATSRDLKKRVAESAFREDLYFRLNVITAEMPPLRHRPDDLIHFADHYFKHFAALCGRRLDGFSEEASAAIRAYSWPGNLRELRNAIERAVIMAKGAKIGLEDLPAELRGRTVAEVNGSDASLQVGSLVSMEQLEEAHLRKVLERTSNLAEAAQVLGIDQATLYRKRKKIGLE
ncbi:MAG TPA: sigma-54 dependent transcriptional regulator [Candidatus Binatia bacterium]|jgi:NtrC-family two-component system response regulator AlgB|nr:sigma-54 dependent transcriptional regulator [Candidatus Binatia bacterium]